MVADNPNYPPPPMKRAKPTGEAELAGAGGSLPASSVQKLLAQWEAEQKDWEYSQEMWRKQLGDEYTAVRFNNCRVRAEALKRIISDLRAEVEAANKRQPGENKDSAT